LRICFIKTVAYDNRVTGNTREHHILQSGSDDLHIMTIAEHEEDIGRPNLQHFPLPQPKYLLMSLLLSFGCRLNSGGVVSK
jgi:hypothetical protein